MKKLVALLLIILLGLSIPACAPSNTGGADGEDQFFVAISFNDLDAVPALMKGYLEAMMDELGWKYVITNADKDASKQVADIENLILLEPDVILCRISTLARPTICQTVGASNIPLVAMSMGTRRQLTPEENEAMLTGVGDSEWVRGIPLGNWMADYIEAHPGFVPKVGFIVGDIGNDAKGQGHRSYDFFRTMQARGYEQGKDWFKVIRAEAQPVWTTSGGMKVTEDWIQKYSIDEMNTIFCWSDEMVVGVCQALEAAGKAPGEYIVLSFDGLEIAHEYVKKGYLQASSAFDFKLQCEKILETLQKIKDGKVSEIQSIEFAHSIYLLTEENIADVEAGNIEYFEYTAETEESPILTGDDWYPDSIKL